MTLTSSINGLLAAHTERWVPRIACFLRKNHVHRGAAAGPDPLVPVGHPGPCAPNEEFTAGNQGNLLDSLEKIL